MRHCGPTKGLTNWLTNRQTYIIQWSGIKTISYICPKGSLHKKRLNLGIGPNLADPLPPPQFGNPKLLFFMIYLGLICHEMYFKINLYFSLTKVVWQLASVVVFWRLQNGSLFGWFGCGTWLDRTDYTIKESYLVKKINISKYQTYPLSKKC